MSWRAKRLVGAPVMILLGLALTWLAETHAANAGLVSAGGAVFGPTAVVLGLAMLAMPGYREERIARGEDISKLQGSALITPRWWGVLVVALAAGFSHFAWLMSGHTLLPR